MTIAAILEGQRGQLVSVPEDMTLGDVVALLAERRIGAVPVMRGSAVVGILSERDVVYGLAREGADLLARTAGAVMTAPVIHAEPAMTALQGLSLMTERRIRHLPVIDRGEIVGIVSIGDLVKHRIRAIETEAETMRAYIQAT